ncbi:hypothetical protein CTI12_AA143150 [Artemisia annua]|nr:hypothetical protein CTI12_AA143150 [Artemisia annua]
MNNQRGVTSPTTVDDIGNQSKHKGLLLGGCLIVGYMYLVKLANLKYHGEEKNPFEKNLLMCTYLLVLIAVGIALAALAYDYGRSMYKKSFSRQVSDGDEVITD